MFNVTDLINTTFNNPSLTTTTVLTEKVKLQRNLRTILQDEQVQALSSFELNQWASLTYHEGHHSAEDDLCEAIFETLQSLLMQHPPHLQQQYQYQQQQQTPRTLQKTLLVTRHVLLVGAEKVIHEAQRLKPVVAVLREYNTALIQQQHQSTNVWLKFKGGVVDEGGPVREIAEALFALLSLSQQALIREREKYADPSSLVPVGSNEEIVFATDEQRLQWLQQRMQHQEQMQRKSNLAKADNGFGGGYSAKNGQSVVGASHSLEEMMDIAKRKEAAKRAQFKDEPSTSRTNDATGFADYEPPFTATTRDEPTTDLLDWQNSYTSTIGVADAGTADLLDFNDTVAEPVGSMGTSHFSTHDDLLSIPVQSKTQYAPAVTSRHSSLHDDLLSLDYSETRVDPFAPWNHQQHPPSMAPTLASTTISTTLITSTASLPVDPFAAFDALGSPPAPAPLSHSVLPISHTSLGNRITEMSHSLANMRILNRSVVSTPSFTQPTVAGTSSIQVSWKPSNTVDNDSDGAFFMGGSVGSGLEPLGTAPAAPPPPPPPTFY